MGDVAVDQDLTSLIEEASRRSAGDYLQIYGLHPSHVALASESSTLLYSPLLCSPLLYSALLSSPLHTHYPRYSALRLSLPYLLFSALLSSPRYFTLPLLLFLHTISPSSSPQVHDFHPVQSPSPSPPNVYVLSSTYPSIHPHFPDNS